MKLFILLLLFIGFFSTGAVAQDHSRDVDRLAGRVSRLESRAKNAGGAGVALLVCAAFCALWAQNSGRNSWLWFFLGLLFSIITLLVLLSKNAGDLRTARRPLSK